MSSSSRECKIRCHMRELVPSSLGFGLSGHDPPQTLSEQLQFPVLSSKNIYRFCTRDTYFLWLLFLLPIAQQRFSHAKKSPKIAKKLFKLIVLKN